MTIARFCRSLHLMLVIGITLGGDILELTDTNFKDSVVGKDIILVFFYAPWCKYCNKLTPQYEEAATALLKNDPPIPLAMVDCIGDGKESCSKYGVSGYPTLKIFRSGEFSQEYGGSRESAGIIAYMKKNAGPSSVDLKDEENLEKPGGTEGVVIVDTQVATSDVRLDNNGTQSRIAEMMLEKARNDTEVRKQAKEAAFKEILKKKYEQQRTNLKLEIIKLRRERKKEEVKAERGKGKEESGENEGKAEYGKVAKEKDECKQENRNEFHKEKAMEGHESKQENSDECHKEKAVEGHKCKQESSNECHKEKAVEGHESNQENSNEFHKENAVEGHECKEENSNECHKGKAVEGHKFKQENSNEFHKEKAVEGHECKQESNECHKEKAAEGHECKQENSNECHKEKAVEGHKEEACFEDNRVCHGKKMKSEGYSQCQDKKYPEKCQESDGRPDQYQPSHYDSYPDGPDSHSDNADYHPDHHDYHPHDHDFRPHDNYYHPHDHDYHPHDHDFHPHDHDYHPKDHDYHPHDNDYHPHDNDYEPHDHDSPPHYYNDHFGEHDGHYDHPEEQYDYQHGDHNHDHAHYDGHRGDEDEMRHNGPDGHDDHRHYNYGGEQCNDEDNTDELCGDFKSSVASVNNTNITQEGKGEHQDSKLNNPVVILLPDKQQTKSEPSEENAKNGNIVQASSSVSVSDDVKPINDSITNGRHDLVALLLVPQANGQQNTKQSEATETNVKIDTNAGGNLARLLSVNSPNCEAVDAKEMEDCVRNYATVKQENSLKVLSNGRDDSQSPRVSQTNKVDVRFKDDGENMDSSISNNGQTVPHNPEVFADNIYLNKSSVSNEKLSHDASISNNGQTVPHNPKVFADIYLNKSGESNEKLPHDVSKPVLNQAEDLSQSMHQNKLLSPQENTGGLNVNTSRILSKLIHRKEKSDFKNSSPGQPVSEILSAAAQQSGQVGNNQPIAVKTGQGNDSQNIASIPSSSLKIEPKVNSDLSDNSALTQESVEKVKLDEKGSKGVPPHTESNEVGVTEKELLNLKSASQNQSKAAKPSESVGGVMLIPTPPSVGSNPDSTEKVNFDITKGKAKLAGPINPMEDKGIAEKENDGTINSKDKSAQMEQIEPIKEQLDSVSQTMNDLFNGLSSVGIFKSYSRERNQK